MFDIIKLGDIMKIDKIKKLNSGKYKIELENKEKIITYDEVILNNNLLYKKDTDSEILNKINVETKYYNIYNKVIKYIGIKLRSEKEINNYLSKQNVIKEDKEKIVDDLKQIDFINDKTFTKAYIDDRLNFSNEGLNKIKRDLLEHNIDEEIIDEEINKIDVEIVKEKLNKYINKKVKLNKKNSFYIFKQKMINELNNLGYDYDDIISSLDNVNMSNNAIDKNYDILFNKLKMKYEGNELYFKIKQKLYQKGFNRDEIEDCIRKKID